MKKFLLVILIVFGLVILASGVGIFYITRGLEEGAKLSINPVDLSQLADGSYDGQYESGRFSNALTLTISDHQITYITVTQTVKFENPEVTKSLIDEVMTAQNTDVDVVSGATVTSKAYLKAMENALTQ
ncbi:FMN-binding protein [Eubacteriaceae bacterium ES2]|nr:FMN-binding protein [Eubacteriaceae bacterium ES2]